MDTFDKYGFKSCMFVNIYEANNYDKNYISDLLKRIDKRGFEVGLHCHKNGLNTMSLDEQRKIYDYGRNFIYQSIGKYPLAYRAGSYYINDYTFEALRDVGFLYDSSIYYDNNHNCLTKNIGNEYGMIEGVEEFPIEVVFDGKSWSKLDIDWLSFDDIIETLSIIKNTTDLKTVQIMFHSFSFIDLGSQDKIALVQDGNKSIVGEDIDDKRKLENLLQYLQKSDEYDVITFGDVKNVNASNNNSSDKTSVIYLKNKEIAFIKKDVNTLLNNNNLYLENNKLGKSFEYAYVIYKKDNFNDKCYESNYSYNNKCVFCPNESLNGIYLVKAYIKDANSNKTSNILFELNIENGIIKDIIK